jgi:carboxyl-terminal processing protease
LLPSIQHRGRTLAHVVAIAFLLWLLPTPAVAQMGGHPEDPRRDAAAAEKRGDWLGACLIYDELLRKDRNQADVREAYRRCLRQAHLTRRHRDSVYREAVSHLTPDQAQALFVQVLRSVSTWYVDKDKLGGSLTPLVVRGIEELRFSLDDEAFVRDHLPDTPPAALEAFRQRLNTWQMGRLTKYSEAREQLVSLARAAQACGILNRPLLAVGIALECSAGVCNSLDEYSLLLSPGYTSDGGARSRPGSLGLDLGLMEGRVEVTRIYPHGAAAEAGLMLHDHIVRVGDKIVDGLATAEVVARLRGEAGTSVELEVMTPSRMDMGPRVVKLVRRPVGVEYCILGDLNDPDPIGYIRIPFFHETTLSEIQEALADFNPHVKAVILDLRGNPGGLLKSALGVSELFLSEGVLAHSVSPYEDYNRSFRTEAHNVYPHPLVVLVDGETASSAELLAGALKDHNRARIMGQTTYGKGSIQCLIPLGENQAGANSIRLTVARFYSPTHQPYSGVGLTPHDLLDAEGEAPVLAARQYLAGLLRQLQMR